MQHSGRFDVAIVGAGVIGVNLAFWLSELYSCSILLIDKEAGVAFHQSSRNTCGVHRPVYMDPKKNEAKWYSKSYELWYRVATMYDVPWRQLGRLNLAFRESDVPVIEEYAKWGTLNGMSDEEMVLLDSSGISKMEPEVRGVMGLLTKKESMTDYGMLCDHVLAWARKNGIKFARGMKVRKIRETEQGADIELQDEASAVVTHVYSSLLINAAGAAALKLARMVGLGKNLSELHMKGVYWVVGGPIVERISSNIYPITKRGIKGIFQSYAGPHLVNRYSAISGWTKELGPTSVPVLGAYAYTGLSEDSSTAFDIIFRRPFGSRLRTFADKEFLSFAWREWRMASSRKSVVEYLQKSIPNLNEGMIVGKGVTGIAWVTLEKTQFASVPILIRGSSSIHILYGGGSATGSPAFAAGVVSWLREKGYLNSFRKNENRSKNSVWNFEAASEAKPDYVL